MKINKIPFGEQIASFKDDSAGMWRIFYRHSNGKRILARLALDNIISNISITPDNRLVFNTSFAQTSKKDIIRSAPLVYPPTQLIDILFVLKEQYKKDELL